MLTDAYNTTSKPADGAHATIRKERWSHCSAQKTKLSNHWQWQAKEETISQAYNSQKQISHLWQQWLQYGWGGQSSKIVLTADGAQTTTSKAQPIQQWNSHLQRAAELGGNLPATGINTQGKWLWFAMEHTQQSARPNQFSSKIILSSVRRNWQAKQNTWHSHSRNDVNNKRNDIFHQVPYPKTVIQTTPVDESLGISISIVMVMRG